MRPAARLVFLSLLAATACTTAIATRDGGLDEPDASTTEPDAVPPVDVCADGGTTTNCFSSGESCKGGGFRYGCYGAPCSIGADRGACTFVRQDPLSGYVETCCEKLTCTLRSPGRDDEQCREQVDAGRIAINFGDSGVTYECPWRNGKPLAKPPGDAGTCVPQHGPPMGDGSSVSMCCAPRK